MGPAGLKEPKRQVPSHISPLSPLSKLDWSRDGRITSEAQIGDYDASNRRPSRNILLEDGTGCGNPRYHQKDPQELAESPVHSRAGAPSGEPVPALDAAGYRVDP